MNKLYLECFLGISGDMTVAALLDLGADQQVLKNALDSIPLKGFEYKITRVKKSGLDACDFDVILDKEHENHDHDMAYLHGKTCEELHVHEHKHSHGVEEHEYVHEDVNAERTHHHEHRGLPEILEIIYSIEMTDHAKEIAVRIFQIIAEAEAKVHGEDINQVHFHEVGAVDSIVDIVAVAVCLDNLDIKDVIVPVLYEGTGFIRCQHGVIPVPVPATSAIVAEHGIKLHLTQTEGEFVTPTGAAIVAAIQTESKLPEAFKIVRMGIGAGKRTYDRPSILRAMLIEADEQNNIEKDTIFKLESNIDDCTGEALGYVMERLLEAGARDVHYMPVYMKKNRPAYQLNVICKKEDIVDLEKIIFSETTTIGIRRQEMERSILKRHSEIRNTSLGKVRVKVCSFPGEERIYPEYDSLKEICAERKLSYQQALKTLQREIQI